jgi:hypothetical protein
VAATLRNSKPDTNGYAYTYCHPYTDADINSYSHGYSDSNPDSNGNTNSHRDPNHYTHSDTYTDCNRNSYTDSDVNSKADSHPKAYTDTEDSSHAATSSNSTKDLERMILWPGTWLSATVRVRETSSSRHAEAHPLGLREAVVLAQVSVHFHAQRAAVFVPEPPRHGRNVHAAFDADRREKTAQIVVGNPFHSIFVAA